MDKDGIRERFEALQWHDSKLRSFSVVRGADNDDIVLHLELRGLSEPELTVATLTLKPATYLKAEVDLDGKYQCSDHIMSAGCDAESELKNELVSSRFKYTPTALDGYYLFDICLIPPGGRIQVFAKDFTLTIA